MIADAMLSQLADNIPITNQQNTTLNMQKAKQQQHNTKYAKTHVIINNHHHHHNKNTGTVLMGYGVARLTSVLFGEMRNAIFGSVTQKAIRSAARNIFFHLLQLDSGFHLARQTGGLVRAIDRHVFLASPSKQRAKRVGCEGEALSSYHAELLARHGSEKSAKLT